MVLVHETPIRRLDVLVADAGIHAEHAIGGVEGDRAALPLGRPLRLRAHQRLDLRELHAPDTESSRDLPQQLALRVGDFTAAHGRLHLNLYECPAEIAAAADAPPELREPLAEGLLRSLAGCEPVAREPHL